MLKLTLRAAHAVPVEAEVLSPDVIAPLKLDDDELNKLLDSLDADGGEGSHATQATANGQLADKFGVPPFSVLNAREGWWQARKAAWVALGIQSEVGRGAALTVNAGLRDGADKDKVKRTHGRKRAGAGNG